MKILFENTGADFCSLVEYVNTFLDENNDDFNLIQLPPIQRNSVWNVAQIERLWDSILRGYPIGSFLVSPRNKTDKARDLTTGKQVESETDGYFLLDGQQRTRSLLLGFRPTDDARLWIDLLPALRFSNIEYNDRKFLFRVLTNYQPWGMNSYSPSEKLDTNTKYKAREEVYKESIRYDYEINIDTGHLTSKDNFHSWPVRATLPVPFDELIRLCGGITGDFKKPDWNLVLDLIPQRFIGNNQQLQEPPTHFKEIVNGIERLISVDNKEIRTCSIVFLLQQESKSNHLEGLQDDMEVLFRRVNSGGTVLQGEEMAYSLLKSAWDGAYDMVSEIVKDKRVGYLFPATGVVMAATRLARYIQNKTDSPNPGIGNFRSWIGETDGERTFLEEMKSLLSMNEQGLTEFHQIMLSFCDLVQYREHLPTDIGLPKKLLLSVKPAIIHPVFVWIYKNNCKSSVLEANRKNVLRYLIYCFLTVDKHDQASKAAIELIKESAPESFPDKHIYDRLVEDQIFVPIPTPDEYSNPFKTTVDGFFRHWNDVFNIENDPFNAIRQWFWNDSREMLLWFQREYYSKWFKGYDPMSNDAYDTPYDWDHIMPKSHLITSGAYPVIYSDNKDLNNKFDWNRHRYVNSIGNYRMWPFWANRSDNNWCHTHKLRMRSTDLATDKDAIELELYSTADFLNASAIPLQDMSLWMNAGGEPRDWPEARRVGWQTAVERRVCYLYEQLYNTLDFSSWK